MLWLWPRTQFARKLQRPFAYSPCKASVGQSTVPAGIIENSTGATVVPCTWRSINRWSGATHGESRSIFLSFHVALPLVRGAARNDGWHLIAMDECTRRPLMPSVCFCCALDPVTSSNRRPHPTMIEPHTCPIGRNTDDSPNAGHISDASALSPGQKFP